jgi:Fe-S-cluster containining protein
VGFFKFLDQNNFSCTNCGKCCASGWKVSIRPSDVVKIEATEAYKTRHRAGLIPIVVLEGQYLVSKAEGVVCTFFTDSGCEIHRELGSSGKPGTCQVYPFQMSVMPDGIHVSLAFSCPAAIAGFGIATQSYEEELSTLFRVPSPDATHDFLRLAGIPIEWVDYCRLEEKMLAQLVLSIDDPVTALIQLACGVIHPEGTTEEVESLYDLAFDLLPLFATSSVSVMESEDTLDGRQEFQNRLMFAEGVMSKRLECHLPLFALCRPRDLITRDVISRYIRQHVEGKRLLSGPTLATRILLLACGVAVVLYLQEALTRKIDPTRFSFEALEKAFELVELEMVTHGDSMDELFEKYESALVKATRGF